MGVSIAPGVGYGFPYLPILSPGAGRFHDFSFPEPSLYAGLGSLQVPHVQANARIGNIGLGAPTWARTVYTADPGTPVPNVVNGVNIITILSAAAAGQSYCAHVFMPRLGPNFVTTDDHAFHRVYWTMAAGNAPANATTDYGGYLVQPVSATPDMRVMGGIAGFGFQFADLHTVNFVAQGPNARVVTPLPIAGNGGTFDATQLHTYELRIAPGTPTAWATLQVLFDGALLNVGALNSSWTPGTNLPGLAINGGHLGFGAGVINNSLASANLLLNVCRAISAPTFQDLF